MEDILKIKNFNDYQFRASGISNIIPNAKTGVMTKTMKTYIRKCFVEYVTHQRKKIHTPIFDKGTICEPLSIALLQDCIYPLSNPKNSLISNNKTRVFNEFVHGEFDVLVERIIYENKNAWDKYTFLEASLTDDYLWQIKTYIWLCGAIKGRLFYTLNNMPKSLLDKAKINLFYDKDYNFNSEFDPNYIAKCKELEAEHNYDDWPVWERYKMWEVKLSESDVETIKSAVINARLYMNEVLEEEKDRISKNKALYHLVRGVA